MFILPRRALRALTALPRRALRALTAPAIFGVALFGMASAAQAAPITIPVGLNPGDTYRLAFVTSTKTMP